MCHVQLAACLRRTPALHLAALINLVSFIYLYKHIIYLISLGTLAKSFAVGQLAHSVFISLSLSRTLPYSFSLAPSLSLCQAPSLSACLQLFGCAPSQSHPFASEQMFCWNSSFGKRARSCSCCLFRFHSVPQPLATASDCILSPQLCGSSRFVNIFPLFAPRVVSPVARCRRCLYVVRRRLSSSLSFALRYVKPKKINNTKIQNTNK